MKIIVGSTNKAKVQAVRNVFKDQRVQSIAAASKVSAQPLSDIETRQGAINRALYAQRFVGEHGIGVGLEGGIMRLDQDTYLCNWGSIVLPTGTIFTAGGTRILLPNSIVEELSQGRELGVVMAQLTQEKNIREKAGSIGVLTNNLVRRQQMYEQVLWLLRGQWEYYKIN